MYRKRLLATVISVFAVGVIFGIFMNDYDTFSFRALFTGLAALSCISFLFARHTKSGDMSERVSAAALAVAAFSFGVLRVALFNASIAENVTYDGVYDTALFEVDEINQYYYDVSIVQSESGVFEGANIRFYPEEMKEVIIGDILSAEVRYKTHNNSNLYANEIILTASGSVVDVKKGNGVVYSIRESVYVNSYVLYEDFDNAGAISRAVTTGDRSGLDSYMFSVYKAGGVSHVLAISGLHISLIAMSLNSFLSIITVNRKAAAVISIIVTIAYTALVGFTAGAVRSAVMIIILLLLRMFLRRSDSITSLFIALLLLLLINPYSIYSAGLQLSFLCSLGIVLVEPMLENINGYFGDKRLSSGGLKRLFYKAVPAVISPIIISFVSSVFSFPVLCTRFDTVTYISPLINIIVVPLFSYAVGFASIAYLIAPLSSVIGSVIAFPAGILFDFVTDLNVFLYDSNMGIMSVHSPLMIIPVIFSFLMIASLVFLSAKRMHIFAASAIMFCITLTISYFLNEVTISNNIVVEYANASASGEYVYLQSPDSNVYFDLNGYTSYPEVIYENGHTSLEYYIVSEYDSYTFKRFDYFSGNMSVNTLNMPKPKNVYENSIYLQIKELANERNCDIIEFDKIYTAGISENTALYLFSKGSLSNGPLVCVDHNGKSIRFVGKGFERAVNCDVAVLTAGYTGDYGMIFADDKYASDEYITNTDGASARFTSYNYRLKFEADIRESEFDIYES